jgi:hypothetical protein
MLIPNSLRKEVADFNPVLSHNSRIAVPHLNLSGYPPTQPVALPFHDGT